MRVLCLFVLSLSGEYTIVVGTAGYTCVVCLRCAMEGNPS